MNMDFQSWCSDFCKKWGSNSGRAHFKFRSCPIQPITAQMIGFQRILQEGGFQQILGGGVYGFGGDEGKGAGYGFGGDKQLQQMNWKTS